MSQSSQSWLTIFLAAFFFCAREMSLKQALGASRASRALKRERC
jgi:hypothetical protein